MSNKYGTIRQEGNKEVFIKTQKKFVPKNQNSNLIESNPKPNLSTSLRQSLSKQSDAPAANSSSAAGTTGRVRLGENGDWVSSGTQGGSFVNYLPQDEAVAAGLSADEGGLDSVESQRVVDLLNRELSRLLKLNPRNFWTEVARDTSLHGFLDSFLQFRSRWYDFPHHGAKGVVAGVIVGELELSRRVFMVLYRISSNRDPGARAADSLSPKDHGVILQENKLLNLPKLLDICATYGYENEDLTRILVSNALKAQSWIHDNLTPAMSHFLSIVNAMYQRCSSSLEVLLSSGSSKDHGSSQLHSDYLEVMDFINDAIVSMDAFVTAYKPAAVYFACPVELSYGNEELLNTLSRLHDSLLPSLQRGFRLILKAGEDGMISDIALSLKMLSRRIVQFGWNLLEICYLSNDVFEDSFPLPPATKMFPANVEDPVIRADILVQTLREINGISLQNLGNEQKGTFLQNFEKVHNIMSKLQSLQNTGWIFIDDEQFHYLSGIVMYSPKASKEPPSTKIPLTSNKLQMDEDAAIMESKISQIKDLFPDYGKGFLAACLEVYNQNPEEVIQRILEGTLHEDLHSLDTSLDTIPTSKLALSVSPNDNGKGKGKLVESTSPKVKTESTTLSTSYTVPLVRGQPVEGPSFSSSSTLGRYVRKFQGDLPESNILDTRNEKDSAIAGAIISQYEYEDEYDDSFDDLGLSVGETGVEENEILRDKMNSNLGKSWGTETEVSPQNPSNSKWGSRKKPQFYVKDGKNYSYKVGGSIAVANSGEASLVTEAQKELIYGLGRGGNLPLGAVKKLTEAYNDQDNQSDGPQSEGTGNVGNPRGRGRRGGGRPRESHGEQDKQSDTSEVEVSGNLGNQRGRGRRGGGRSNNYRKDRAMNKHFAGVTGF